MSELSIPHRAARLALGVLAFAAVQACSSEDAGPLPEDLGAANVVIVMVDTLRADRLGCYGYERPTSPFVDELAARSVVFERASSTSSQTVPAVVSTFSGRYPAHHGNQYFHGPRSFRFNLPNTLPEIRDDVPLLARYFAERGWATGAVVTNPWLLPRFGFGRGFDEYVDLWKSAREELEPKPRGDAVNEEARRLLDDFAPGPFLLYLHYMDVHAPYRPPSPYREQLEPAEPGSLVYATGPIDVAPYDLAYTEALYDAEIRALDDHLRGLFDLLEAKGLTDSTLVVLVADHGDEFVEHGGMGHGTTLYEELVHVPMIFAHPRLRARRLELPVSLVDVFPTLAALTAGPPPPGVDGISLAPWVLGREQAGIPDRVLLCELGEIKAVRAGSHKLIRWLAERRQEAFDLASDPGEHSPVARGLELDASAPAWAVRLDAALSEVPGADRIAPPPVPETPRELSPIERQALEQLKLLGYSK